MAIGLLTQEELNNIGTGLRRLYPISDEGDFDELLQRIGRTVRRQSWKR